MKNFVPAPKSVKPVFTVNPERQLKPKSLEPVYLLPDYELYIPQTFSWEKSNGDIERLSDMNPYHIIQIMRTMTDQGINHSRCWYKFDQALRRKFVGMTGRITKLNGGRPVVICHGPGYSACR